MSSNHLVREDHRREKRLLYSSIYHAVAEILVYTYRTAISVIRWGARLDAGTECCAGGGN